MKCPGCGCNYMDEDRFCPMCELPNNAFARAAHKLRRNRHERDADDCDMTTCAHDRFDQAERRQQLEQQRAKRLGKQAHTPRLAKSSAQPATSSAPRRKKNKGSTAARIIKTVVGIVVLVNIVLPLIFGLLELLFFGFF